MRNIADFIIRDEADRNFLKIGISEYNKYGLKQKDMEGTNILDGMQPPEVLSTKILSDISNH